MQSLHFHSLVFLAPHKEGDADVAVEETGAAAGASLLTVVVGLAPNVNGAFETAAGAVVTPTAATAGAGVEPATLVVGFRPKLNAGAFDDTVPSDPELLAVTPGLLAPHDAHFVKDSPF